jgi:hypothetical protein
MKCSRNLIAYSPRLLHLVYNLLCLCQAFHHLLAILPPPDCVIGLLQQLVKLVGLVHVGEQLALHVLPRPRDEVQHDGLGHHIDHCAADNVEV